MAARPVKSAFLAGTFQIGGILPGKRGTSACAVPAAERLRGPVESPQQLRGGLAGVHPRQVDDGVVREGFGEPHITDPDGHELAVVPGRVHGQQRLPYRPGRG